MSAFCERDERKKPWGWHRWQDGCWGWLFFCAIAGAGQVVGQGAAVPPPGFYDRPVSVVLPPGVRYTLDGSTPRPTSPAYREPLYLPATAVVRYADFRAEAPGLVRGGSYLIAEPETRLLTLSVGIDPWRLFDPARGWFRAGPQADRRDWKQPGANWWTRAEHPAHLDIIEPSGKCVHTSTVGFRMFGGMSRLHPQKSFSLSAREKYGAKRFRYPLFGPGGPPDCRFLVVRNGGSDWQRAYIRDALLTSLLQDDSWDLERQAARPVQVYLNGEYYGIYHLREKINARFLADRHPATNKEQIDLLEHRQTVKQGNATAYEALLRFVATHDLADPVHYQTLGTLMDIDNYARLQIAQTYFDNRDAGGNIRYWRDRSDPASRWRWILYDVDQGFGLHSDTAWQRNTLAFYTDPAGPSWPNPPWSTWLQRRLLTNPDYRRRFVNWTLDYLHTDFAASTVTVAIQRHETRLAFDMPRQLRRWGDQEKHWRLHLDRLRTFARQRPEQLRGHLRHFFSGGADVPVTLSVGPGGYVEVNDNLRVGRAGLRGRYFASFPLHLRPRPLPGYRFAGWKDRKGSLLELDLSDGRPQTLQATFVRQEQSLPPAVVISKICPVDPVTGDWLELHNRSASPVTLTGWRLSDTRQAFVLPAAVLPPDGRVVVGEHPERLGVRFPVATILGPLPFGIRKRGESLRLTDARGQLVEQVDFRPAALPATDTSLVFVPAADGPERPWRLVPLATASAAAVLAKPRTGSPPRRGYRLTIGVALLLLVVGVRVFTSRSGD